MTERSGVPFNVPFATGDELANIERGRARAAHLERRTLLEAVRALARGAAAESAGSPRALVHCGSRDVRSAARGGAGRRGHPAVLHLRVDGQRLRAARRNAGLRRHRSETLNLCTRSGRGGGQRVDEGDRRRALRRRRLRHDGAREIADESGAVLVEDAAQALGATYRRATSRRLAPLAAVSFTRPRTLISGEGGALLINEEIATFERAEILARQGHRPQRLSARRDGQVSVDGPRLLLRPSEIVAAFSGRSARFRAKAILKRAASRSVAEVPPSSSSLSRLAGLLRRPDRACELRAQRAPLLRADVRPPSSAPASCRRCARKASTASFTTCRCTRLPLGDATVVRPRLDGGHGRRECSKLAAPAAVDGDDGRRPATRGGRSRAGARGLPMSEALGPHCRWSARSTSPRTAWRSSAAGCLQRRPKPVAGERGVEIVLVEDASPGSDRGPRSSSSRSLDPRVRGVRLESELRTASRPDRRNRRSARRPHRGHGLRPPGPARRDPDASARARRRRRRRPDAPRRAPRVGPARGAVEGSSSGCSTNCRRTSYPTRWERFPQCARASRVEFLEGRRSSQLLPHGSRLARLSRPRSSTSQAGRPICRQVVVLDAEGAALRHRRRRLAVDGAAAGEHHARAWCSGSSRSARSSRSSTASSYNNAILPGWSSLMVVHLVRRRQRAAVARCILGLYLGQVLESARDRPLYVVATRTHETKNERRGQRRGLLYAPQPGPAWRRSHAANPDCNVATREGWRDPVQLARDADRTARTWPPRTSPARRRLTPRRRSTVCGQAGRGSMKRRCWLAPGAPGTFDQHGVTCRLSFANDGRPALLPRRGISTGPGHFNNTIGLAERNDARHASSRRSDQPGARTLGRRSAFTLSYPWVLQQGARSGSSGTAPPSQWLEGDDMRHVIKRAVSQSTVLHWDHDRRDLSSKETLSAESGPLSRPCVLAADSGATACGSQCTRRALPHRLRRVCRTA